MQKRRNFSALAMELRLFCIKPSMSYIWHMMKLKSSQPRHVQPHDMCTDFETLLMQNHNSSSQWDLLDIELAKREHGMEKFKTIDCNFRWAMKSSSTTLRCST